jgi:hypothetical protein
MSFLTEEQLKYAKRMEDSFNEVIPDGLDQVPNTLILKYGTPTTPWGVLYALFLHFKHVSEQRHFFMIARHHAIQQKLSKTTSHLETLISQNKILYSEIQTLKQFMSSSSSTSYEAAQCSFLSSDSFTSSLSSSSPSCNRLNIKPLDSSHIQSQYIDDTIVPSYISQYAQSNT